METSLSATPDDFVISASKLVHLYDAIPDVSFFVKDAAGRYTHVTMTLVRRLGLQSRADVIGRRPSDLFASPLGEAYEKQDADVLHGHDLTNQLELHHPFYNQALGWCLTRKFSLHEHGKVTGLVGMTRGLRNHELREKLYPRLETILEHMRAHINEPARMSELAKIAEASVTQLGRTFLYVFQITPAQMMTKLRIEVAMQMLDKDDAIAEVAQACGYSDQSALSRQFRKVTGLTPRQYQVMYRNTDQPVA